MAKQFEFQAEHDGTLSMSAAVYQAIGAASVCWSDMKGTGVFEDRKARDIANALLDFINGHDPLSPNAPKQVPPMDSSKESC